MPFARVASIAAAVALTASCGGDEDAPLSAEEFRDRAEAQCREIEETDVRPPSDVSDLDRYANEFTAVFEATVSETRKLEPPEEFQDRWQEYLALLDDALSRFHELTDEIEGASPEKITRLVREFDADFEELERRGHAIERELGLDECID
jgi:hypothetical protein